MTFQYNHVVHVRLRNRHLLDLEGRTQDVQEFREWLDELTEWQPNQYQWVTRKDGTVDVWFNSPVHAIMCKLRWS